MTRIVDQVAVVTGAASGIGRAVSVALATKGADVALVDIDEAGLAATARAVSAEGRAASTHLVDVSSQAQMRTLPDRVLAAHGRVAILVNNAGVSVNLPFEDQDLDDLRWITGINYWGVLHGCHYFLPHLLRADDGHIVNISSSAGLTGMKNQSSYAATKFAVRGLSESLYVELAPTSVGVTCVHPGAVATDILASAHMDPDRKQKLGRLFEHAMPADKAARLIVGAIEKNRFKLVFGADARALGMLNHVAPVGLLRLMRLAERRSEPGDHKASP